MSVFNAYARYYDLLYRDKDYSSEAQHVHETLQKHAPGATSILEFGCGTCGHAVHLAEKGYSLLGIDSSRDMLEQAQERLASLSPLTSSRISLSQSDLRHYRSDQRFDAVIALFHVISYLPTNADLQAALNTAKTQLKPGGLFLSDCWYGPAVLTDPPAVRIKRMEDESTQITRIAEPKLIPEANLVEVSYQVFVLDKRTTKVDVIRESHTMRYWFQPEIELCMKQTGFQLIDSFEWMTGRRSGTDTWSVCFLSRS